MSSKSEKVLQTEDKGLKIKSDILNENFGIPLQVLNVTEFLDFWENFLAKSKINSLQQLTDFLNEDIVPERFVKSVNSTKFKRITHIYEPKNNYFDYFNFLEYVVDEEQGSFITLTSKKPNPLSNLFFSEFEIILNKIVKAFGEDINGCSRYNEKDLAQLKENKWEGRLWVTPNLKILLENNIGTGRLTLSITINLEEKLNSMVEAEAYLKEKQIELSNSITGKTRIYLDTNYWIKLKEQSLKTNPEERKFFDLVSALARTGRFVFPVSEITYYEVLKNTNPEGLRQTIKIVDEFSQGITMVTQREMIRLEFKGYINKLTNGDTETVKKLIWTKLPFAAYPNLANNWLMNKAMTDQIWNTSFTDVFEELNKDSTYKPFTFEDNVDYFNEQKKIHKDENNTFHQLFMSELGGVLDLFDDIYINVMAEKYFEASGRYPTKEELEQEDQTIFRKFIYHAFRLCKIKDELPTLRIPSGLFANNRWNKSKVHDKNDTTDFFHAAFALPYCDYFFTEKSLGNALTQKHLGYDELYNCKVLYKENDVINTLNGLV